uniref:Uncharacterized protein n=1 Tax=Cyprinodon variegatus TaxID=28743 RepID=A0A3Q2C9T4_CYPVA
MANLLASPTVVQRHFKVEALKVLTFALIPISDPHVTSWALSCFALGKRSAWRHTRKLSRVSSISKPTSMMRMFTERYSCGEEGQKLRSK